MTFEKFVEQYIAQEEAEELATYLCAVRTRHFMKQAEKIWKKAKETP